MTATHDPYPTHAILVGMLRQRTRDRQRVTPMGALIDDMMLDLVTPFGMPFGVNLTLAPVLDGIQHLWASEAAHTPVVVEGHVRVEIQHDTRFAHAQQALGQLTRAMQMVVTRVRPATADDPLGETAIWLEGTIQRAPVFVRHPMLPGVRVALTQLAIRRERPSAFFGSAQLREEHHEVTVAVQTTHPAAGLLYRPGNRVRVQGALDCVLIERAQLGLPQLADADGAADTEGAETLDPAVQLIHERYREAVRRLAQKATPQQLESVYDSYLRKLRQLADTPRYRVLAALIEPADEAALPMSQGAARRLRRRSTDVEQERRPGAERMRAAVVPEPSDPPAQNAAPGLARPAAHAWQPQPAKDAVMPAGHDRVSNEDAATPAAPPRRLRRGPAKATPTRAVESPPVEAPQEIPAGGAEEPRAATEPAASQAAAGGAEEPRAATEPAASHELPAEESLSAPALDGQTDTAGA